MFVLSGLVLPNSSRPLSEFLQLLQLFQCFTTKVIQYYLFMSAFICNYLDSEALGRNFLICVWGSCFVVGYVYCMRFE